MIVLTSDLMKKLFPAMSTDQVQAFVNHQADMHEILMSPERTAMCFANCYAETSGFALHGLTENIMYTAERMATVWPRRFGDTVRKGDRVVYVPNPAKVVEKYGNGRGWQYKAFDDIYGNRMGNRPGTSDGSRYIGRGGPQLTGLDEYRDIGNRIGVDLLTNPELACSPDHQPEILGAYWAQKKLSGPADQKNVVAVRHIWNGGENGLDVVQKQFPRMLKILQSYSPDSAAPVIAPQRARRDENLATIQQELLDMGYYQVGSVDGLIGGSTLGAIKAFYVDRGVDAAAEYPSQVLETAINQAVKEGWHKPVSVARGTASVSEVATKVESVQHVQSAGFIGKIGAWFSGLGIAGKGAFYMMPDMQSSATPYIDMIKETFTDIPPWVYFVGMFLVCYLIVRSTGLASKATQADYQKGRIS